MKWPAWKLGSQGLLHDIHDCHLYSARMYLPTNSSQCLLSFDKERSLLFLSLAFFSFSLSWRLIHFSQVRFLSVGVNGRQHIVQWTLVHREFIFLIAVIFYFIIRSVKEMHKSCHHIFYMLDLLSSSARVFIYDCSTSLMIYMFSWRHITIKLFL